MVRGLSGSPLFVRGIVASKIQGFPAQESWRQVVCAAAVARGSWQVEVLGLEQNGPGWP